MSKKFFKLVLVLVALVLVTSACTLPWKKSPKTNLPTGNNSDDSNSAASTESRTNRLKKFNNYEELAQFLADNSNPESGYGRNLLTFGMESSGSSLVKSLATPQAAGSDAAASAADDSSTPNNSLDYSGTNNQVQGVDEADIIKTDGRYIYALVRNELSIIKATPAVEAEVVAKITFKSRPQDIFINGNFLAVFGSDNQIYNEPLYQTFRRQNQYTFFKVFDLSDPTNPQVVRDLDFEGSYFDARLIGDYVYLLTSTYGSYIAKEPLLPRVLDNGQVMTAKCAEATKCFAPDVFYFDIPYDSYSFTNITAINIKDNAESLGGQVYLLNNGQNLYVSQNNIYITYTQYLSEYDLEQTVKRELLFSKLSADDQDKIKQIEDAPNFILNVNEKKAKIAQLIDRYLSSLSQDEAATTQTAIETALKQKLVEKEKEMEKTIIHKIAISGNKIEYQAMGEVNGQVLNQFSLDENGDYFRIATTKSQTWSRLSEATQDSYSNIYVLDKGLKLVGSLENLASSERIYAARFMGNRVYLVTFRQTDPLYVISLADPTKPTVLGAVKIPGFSNYLHPVDADGTKLLGLGRDAEEDTNGGVKIKGLKLTLFDFSDLSQPKELDSYLIGDYASDSIALHDHKAFLYSAEKNLISFPAVMYKDSHLTFAGALVFSLENNSLQLKSQIDHSDGGRYTQSDYWDGYGYYDNTVKRSLYIDDQLYTFSNKFLKVNNLADFKETKSLELTVGGDDYIITPMSKPDSGSAAGGESGSLPGSTPPDVNGTSTGADV